MAIKLKKWTGLGLTTALLTTTLVACGEGGENGEGGETGEGYKTEAAGTMGEAGESGKAAGGEAGEGEGGAGEGEGGEMGHSMDTLPLPNRLAFMSGHVEAGLALYRAGEPEMAAPHLLHPVSETHEAERKGLDELGFDPAVFEEVSVALEAGRPAEEIEPLLQAAEENLAMMAEKAGGDPAEIIRYLMATVVEEYTIAITDGVVSDPGEYQDAFGFSIVARDRAAALSDQYRDGTIAELTRLIGLWPGAPIPPEAPTPVAQVLAQTSSVLLQLPPEE